MRSIEGMTITATTADVLKRVRANRDEHARLVEEARKGYMDQAEAQLAERLADLRTGKTVSLAFSLRPPQDYTNEYNVAIEMLELHTGSGAKTIDLTSQEVRCLVMDKWEWARDFYVGNAQYSNRTVAKGTQEGWL